MKYSAECKEDWIELWITLGKKFQQLKKRNKELEEKLERLERRVARFTKVETGSYAEDR